MLVLFNSLFQTFGMANVVSTILQFQNINVIHNISILRVPRRCLRHFALSSFAARGRSYAAHHFAYT